MEVDSAGEQEQDARSRGGKGQGSKGKSAATFNTLSSLSSLRPGILFTRARRHLVGVCGVLYHQNQQSFTPESNG